MTDTGRPRYRALARRFYDHEPGDCTPDDPTHLGHLSFCHAGWELTVFRVDDAWRYAAGAAWFWKPIGVTRTSSRVWDPGGVRRTVADWLLALAAPHPSDVASTDVEVYREVP